MRHVGTHAFDGDDPRAGRARVSVIHDQEGHRLHLRLPPHKGVVETDLRHSPELTGDTEVRGVVPAARDALLAPNAEG